ncbi:MAG TPA: MBL fold metallo-hydrolase [Bacilli bacterium]|nr:MBL fold metallo-hydrolase [Bacilli bacterium]
MDQNPIKITRINRQSWFQITFNNIIIHIDPGYAGLFENQGINKSVFEKKADYIVISHNHKDHLRMDMIEQLQSYRTIVIAPPVCRDGLTIPFIELLSGSKYSNNDIKVEAVPAYNTEKGRSIRKFHHKGDFNGYIIEMDGKRIYFAGDTDVIDEMSTFCNLDVAILPIGGTYVMDLEEAVDASLILKPKVVIPMHQAEASLEEFKARIESFGISCTVLQIGESLNL